MILESLQKKEKTFLKLESCTSLSEDTLQYILESLISKNLIIIKESTYHLNRNINDQMKKSLKNISEINIEAKDIFTNIIRLKQKENANFKLKKFYVSKQEELTLQGLIGQLDRFIDSLHKNIEKPISEQKVIFWGEGNYGKIINSCIHI